MNWILAQEPSSCRIVVSGAVKIETCLRVELAARVAEGVGERTGRCGLIPERVERVRLRQCSRRVAQRRYGSETISFVVGRCAGTEHGKRFINLLGLRVPSDENACRVRFLNQVVAVVGVDAGGTGRGFVDSPSEGVVLEADRRVTLPSSPVNHAHRRQEPVAFAALA